MLITHGYKLKNDQKLKSVVERNGESNEKI